MFARRTSFAHPTAPARWHRGTPLALCVGLVLALSANDAFAAALGSLVTSVGLFAALAALFVVKGWPGQLPASALSIAGGALVIAGGAAWLWRARFGGRWSAGLAETRGRQRQPAVGVAAQVPSRSAVALPAGIDRDALLVELRLHFVRLQEAWDQRAMAALQALTTPEMLDELRLGLPACIGDGSTAGCTDVVTLHADLFAFEELSGAYLASVEFSGLMRESTGQCAAPFRELWMLTRSKGGSPGWKLARHQALL
ncbi:MAG: Tim44 domain-containing protein [Rhizobiales bacterium]|nr:Tim44 domain-containing protein [Rhizobacter sp.]